MRHIMKLSNTVSTIFSLLFIMSCNSGDDDDATTTAASTPSIAIEEGMLKDFPLFALQYKEINIVDPEIVDNKEVKYGEIKITIPSTVSLDNIYASITSAELNLSKFSISPGNDVGLSYEDQKINVYTITTATGDKKELLHYNVSIVKEIVPEPETLKITSFTFEKSKNPDLPNDIEISTRIEDNYRDKIYLFVPLGTDFTNLTPTITYDGAKLYYTQDSSEAEYPEEGTSIDFKYPKYFMLSVKDAGGEKYKITDVIVDVINPVRIETVSVTTPDTKQQTRGYFTGVTKLTNQGNHKIIYRSTSYENMSPVITPVSNVITANRSTPSGGLIPGESCDINIIVNGYFPEGTYKTTAVFYSKIQYNDYEEVSDLLEPVRLDITSKIVK